MERFVLKAVLTILGWNQVFQSG